MKILKRNDTDDPIVNEIYKEKMINLLSIPREKIHIGDVYRNDEENKRLFPLTHINNFLTSPIGEIEKDYENMAPISGLTYKGIEANMALNFLENFLIVMAGTDIATTIRTHYNNLAVRTIKFDFENLQREFLKDKFLFAEQLSNKQVKTDNFAYDHKRSYFIVEGILTSDSIGIIDDYKGTKEGDLELNQNTLGNIKMNISKENTGERKTTYKGDKRLVLGIELFELIYENENKSFKLNVVKKPYRLREKEIVRKNIECIYFGNSEDSIFIEIAEGNH